MNIISWNIAHRDEAWQYLLDTRADIALLQEASSPPAEVAEQLDVDQAPWHTDGAGLNRPWRSAVVKLSNQVSVQWLDPKTLAEASPGEFAVSRLGTLAVAVVSPTTGDPILVASMYAPWENPL